MKIGEFRAAVDSLNWNRRDLSGATRQEFVAMDVRTRGLSVTSSSSPGCCRWCMRGSGMTWCMRPRPSSRHKPPSFDGRATGPRPDPTKRGALFGALPRGRWRLSSNSPRQTASWALRAGVGEVRSSRDGSRLVALLLHAGCPGPRHPFGAGLNPVEQAQRGALGFGSALRWLKCAAVRR